MNDPVRKRGVNLSPNIRKEAIKVAIGCMYSFSDAIKGEELRTAYWYKK